MYALLVTPPGEDTNKLVTELRRHQVECSLAGSSQAALQNSDAKLPDVLLIGIDRSSETDALCQFLKTKKVPVVELAASRALLHLNPYADDFVLEPYRAAEIAARIRRLLQQKIVIKGSDQIIAGSLVIDTAKYEVYNHGTLIELTFKEYELLKFLAGNPGRVFTRDSLLNQVWGSDYFGGDRTVDVHIRRLRGKIETDSQTYIETVRNIGYRFKKF